MLPSPPMAEPAAPSSPLRLADRAGVLLAIGLALATLPVLLFPGDAPFVNDEPLLILDALHKNARHLPALHGLTGNRGVFYGPVPTWIYQLVLAFTHDPVTLVLVHGAILGLGVGLALWLLARDTRLWAPFAVVIPLSPVIWYQERLLWDNTFNLPLCALAVAAYVRFLAGRARAALAVAVALALVALFVHPMALAVAVPLALHMLLFERRALAREARVVFAFPALFMAASIPYLGAVLRSSSASAMFQPTLTSPLVDGLAFPLLGGRLLSAAEFFDWAPGPLAQAARWVTAVAYPLVWAGMAVAASRVVSVVRGRRTAELRDHVAGLALAMVLAQSLLDGVLRLAVYTHYLNASWIAYAILAWVAVDALVRARSRFCRVLGTLVLAHGAALLVYDVALVGTIHTSPGQQYGATIANQAEVARAVDRYPPGTPVTSDVFPYRDFPHALAAMRMLLGPAPPPVDSARSLVIRSVGGRAVVTAE